MAKTVLIISVYKVLHQWTQLAINQNHSVRLNGDKNWKKSWSFLVSNMNFIIKVGMVRLWIPLSFGEQKSDHMLGEGGLKPSSLSMDRPQNNIMGHQTGPQQLALPGQNLELLINPCDSWVPWWLHVADPGLQPVSSSRSTRASFRGGSSSCTNLVSAEM